MTARAIEERFWSKVDKASTDGQGCWEWSAGTTHGYGTFYRGGGRVSRSSANAHRVAYELAVGPIPEGLVLDHLCRNPACVNPAHLEAVTQKENLLRGAGVNGVHASRTHCPAGHAYTPDNLLAANLRRGQRNCKTCARLKAQEKRASKLPKGFMHGVVNGERVILATQPAIRERGIQIQIRAALASVGVRVMPHDVQRCWKCSARPRTTTGLGEHVADLICVVPPMGRFLAIEVKTKARKNLAANEPQREWAKWIRHYGGVAGVATTVEEAMALLAIARAT